MNEKLFMIYVILHYSFLFVCFYIIELYNKKLLTKSELINKVIVGILFGLPVLFNIISIKEIGISNIPDGRYIIPLIVIIYYGKTEGITNYITIIALSLLAGYEDIYVLIAFSSFFLILGFIARLYTIKYPNKIPFITLCASALAFTCVIAFSIFYNSKLETQDLFLTNTLIMYISVLILTLVLSLVVTHERELSKKIKELQENKKELRNKYEETQALYEQIYATELVLKKNVDEMLQLNNEINTRKEQYALVIEASKDGFIDWEPHLERIDISPRVLEIFKYTPEEKEYVLNEIFKIRSRSSALIQEDNVQNVISIIDRVLQENEDTQDIVIKVKCKDGSFKWVSFNVISLIDDGMVKRVVCAVSDIDEKYTKELLIKKLAYYDKDTNVKNIASYLENQSIMNSAITFLLIDDFNTYADDFGYDFCKVFKTQMKNIILSDNSCIIDLYYIDAGLFVIEYNKDASRESIKSYLNTMCNNNEFEIEHNNLKLLVNYQSITFYNPSQLQSDISNEALVIKAKVGLMYCEKNKMLGNIDFSNVIQEYENSIYTIRKQLFNKNLYTELFVVFQPQYSEINTSPIGFEALIRWNSPILGNVRPDLFIPIAEKIGIINKIDQFVWDESFKFIREYNKIHEENAYVSLNISAVDLMDPQMAIKFIDSFNKYGFGVEKVKLEITETAIIDSEHIILNNIKLLKDKGFEMHLDDFGTGYSSLKHLVYTGVSAIKIDKSFIDNFLYNQDVYNIVKGIILLAHELDLEVISEGVETIEQYNALKLLNCDKFQGYLLSRPLAKDIILSKLLG